MAVRHVDRLRALAKRRIDAVAIGASAGGVGALLKLLAGLPAGYALPIVVVLHLPEDHDSSLADTFARRVRLPAHEVVDKQQIERGTLYFACPGYHLSIEHDRSFSLSCEPPVHYSRPSIDVLMESAAEVYGPLLAAILLTGANADGAAGLARVKECGGLTVVQNPAEAEVATMPEAAIARQAPDFILHLTEIRMLLQRLDR